MKIKKQKTVLGVSIFARELTALEIKTITKIKTGYGARIDFVRSSLNGLTESKSVVETAIILESIKAKHSITIVKGVYTDGTGKSANWFKCIKSDFRSELKNTFNVNMKGEALKTEAEKKTASEKLEAEKLDALRETLRENGELVSTDALTLSELCELVLENLARMKVSTDTFAVTIKKFKM